MTNDHAMPAIWRGEWIDDATTKLESLAQTLSKDLALRLDVHALLDAAEKLSADLLAGRAQHLGKSLEQRDMSPREIDETLQTLGAFLQRDNLETKLQSELGNDNPLNVRRRDFTEDVFEGWAPLGVLVHVAAGNAPTVAPLSVVEGLLAGNINLLKISSRDSDFAQHVLEALVAASRDRCLAPFVYAFRFSSRRTDIMQLLVDQADGIAAWGGETAIESVSSMARSGTRIIPWGHKISFAYVCPSVADDPAVLEGVARDMCRIEQQACSSPQCVFLGTEDRGEVLRFAQRLAEHLPAISPEYGTPAPSDAEAAEITSKTELARLDACMGRGEVIESGDRTWRLLVDYDPHLRPSPLFRTLWVKPLPRERIVETLRPLRSYLQTAGLACDSFEAAPVSRALFAAGVTRIVEPGRALEFYGGEPHDGVYALPRYARRICARMGDKLAGASSFAEFEPAEAPSLEPGTPIMTKEDFLKHDVDAGSAELFFKSGGSSGAPKTSIFTYDDYHAQMLATADGLYAAGLDPSTDRCMNLFYAGRLYGGFLSFFTILETMKAPQLPMGLINETEDIASVIIQYKVNTLLGTPSHMLKMFREQEEALAQYRGIKKIFYGGESFAASQIEWLREVFGVELVKSGVYGSNDAGPIGYSVKEYPNTVHCLMSSNQWMEIVKMDEDAPAEFGETGRVLLTSRQRTGQRIERYEIGDLARWVEEPVKTGRTGPFFELMGRFGDFFKCGGPFLNYHDVADTLDAYGYNGRVQLVVTNEQGVDHVQICLEEGQGVDCAAIRTYLVANCPGLGFIVDEVKTARFDVAQIPSRDFVVVGSSGKLQAVVDKRSHQ